MADHDAALRHRSETGTQPLALAHCGNSRTGTTLGGHDCQRADRVLAAHTVGRGPAVRLKFLERPRCAGAENSVHAPTVEAKTSKPGLQLGNVVSAKVRRRQIQEAVTQLPAGLDECGPCLFVAASVAPQPAPELKGANSVFSGRTKSRRLGAGGGWEPGGAEAALQIAYCLAALTGCQREVGRNSLSSCNS